MDQKSSRVFVRSVVTHLQKSIKSFDETKPEIIINEIEEHLKMIKMAYNMHSSPKKKKAKKKTKKKPAVEGEVAVVVVAAADTESK